MRREFIHTKEFDRRWIEVGLDEWSLQRIQNRIMDHPDCGNPIQGCGGLRKIRTGLFGRGKRGGARVLYIDFPEFQSTYLLTVFAKNDKTDLSGPEKEDIHRLVILLKETIQRSNKSEV